MTCMCVGFLHVHTHDGKKKLAQGPDLPSYRGVSIINSRKFSMAPRDMLRRRVRVSEHYRIPWDLDGCLNTDTSFFGAATQNCLDIKCKQKKCLLCTAKDFKNCTKNLTQLADEMDKLYKNQKRSQNVRRRKRRDLRKTKEKRTQYYAGNRK